VERRAAIFSRDLRVSSAGPGLHVNARLEMIQRSNVLDQLLFTDPYPQNDHREFRIRNLYKTTDGEKKLTVLVKMFNFATGTFLKLQMVKNS